jgi:phosphate transport system protein
MTRLIDPSLQKLSFIMGEMGDMVVESISLAIDSYLDGTNTMDQVLALSNSIRSKYYEVEDLTFDMLLKYQPVADDFRFIRSSTEISYAFSRFGRYAYDITQVRDLFGDVSECTNASLVESTKKVKHMIKEAVLSFAELDVRRAIAIREDEKVIDRIYKERLPKLIESNNTKCALAEALLLRYLERIGDHAVFMSDAINYIVTGKHRPSEERIASHTKQHPQSS